MLQPEDPGGRDIQVGGGVGGGRWEVLAREAYRAKGVKFSKGQSHRLEDEQF